MTGPSHPVAARKLVFVCVYLTQGKLFRITTTAPSGLGGDIMALAVDRRPICHGGSDIDTGSVSQ